MRRFWEHLYPQQDDGGTYHRANILRWINGKLLPALKQVPLSAAPSGTDYSWADREAAWRREQQETPEDQAHDGPSLQDVATAMAQSPAQHQLALQSDLRRALDAATHLAHTIDVYFEGEKPSLSTFTGLLKQILAAVETEFHRRGLLPPQLDEQPEPAFAKHVTGRA